MKRLTPKQAWEKYCEDDSIELFVSLFITDGITDVKRMCEIYAQDIPVLFGRPFAQDDLDNIAKLLEQHINETGYEEKNLLSKEELDKLWDENVNAIISMVKRKW